MIAQVIGNSIINGSVYAVIAFGFTLMYGSMNFFNMAYGTNVLVGAYVFYIFHILLGVPIVIAALISCIVTALFMVLIDRVCYFGMRQKRVPSWALVVMSMAVALMLESIISMIFGSKTLFVYEGIPKIYNIFGVNITSVQLIVFVTAVVVMVAASLFLKKTRTGKIIRAISNDRQMATVIGINVEKYFRVIIIVSSTLATVAAVLLALDTDIRPRMSGPALLKAITASIVGGVGNIKGAMLAGMAFGFIENFTTLFIGSGWKDAVALFILVCMMLVFPSYFREKEAGK